MYNQQQDKHGECKTCKYYSNSFCIGLRIKVREDFYCKYYTLNEKLVSYIKPLTIKEISETTLELLNKSLHSRSRN